jgi:trans-aconitate 2-methyltransferase
MLDARHGEELPADLRFEVGVIESFPGDRGAFDLVFSNAALHWVEDHEALLARLAAALAPGGQVAFQVPASHHDATHVVAEELTEVEPFRSALGGWHRPQPVLTPECYARLLFRLGFADPEVRLIVYAHVLAGRDEVLPPDLFERFVGDYRARLLDRLAADQPFFFPFKRILCWGQRSASPRDRAATIRTCGGHDNDA